MIIGRAIGRLLDSNPITVNGVDCKYNYGNQDALDKFIALSDKKGARKYPLIFYVINDTKDLNNWKYSNTNIIIMMNTKEELLYKDRTDKTYVAYIEPIYHQLRTIINHSPYITLLGERIDKFSYNDIPNFGITKNEVGSKKSDKSVVTDYVDARIVKMNFKIKTNCI